MDGFTLNAPRILTLLSPNHSIATSGSHRTFTPPLEFATLAKGAKATGTQVRDSLGNFDVPLRKLTEWARPNDFSQVGAIE